MGFSVPLADWFKNEIKESAQYYLIDQVEGLAEVFKLEKIKEYWQQHQQGQADHSAILWSMLMYEMWWHRYIKNA